MAANRDRLIIRELMREFVGALQGDAEMATRILTQCAQRVDATIAAQPEVSGDLTPSVERISAMRTVNHNYTADQLGALREQCLDEQQVHRAIGYLSTWNLTFPVVDLCILGGHNELEVLAVYRKEAGGPIGYSIGAVWHNDHFGFHS